MCIHVIATHLTFGIRDLIRVVGLPFIPTMGTIVGTLSKPPLPCFCIREEITIKSAHANSTHLEHVFVSL